MMTFVQNILVIFISFTCTCCLVPAAQEKESEAFQQDNEFSEYGAVATTAKNDNSPQTQKEVQDRIKYFENYDPKTGMVSSTIPFPANWSQLRNNRDYTFEGPRNLKVSGSFGRQFTYGNGYYQTNSTPPMDIQGVIESFLMPTARETNRTLLRTYELPSLATNFQKFREQLWSYAPTRKSTVAYGIDWKDTQGIQYVTVLYINKDESQYGNSWNFHGQYLQARSADFKEAKKAFLYGLENTRYNPQWIAAQNNSDMNRANVSHTAHQRRMAAIQARGNAARELSKTYSEISDISHAGYLKRSNINSQGHSSTINMIGENTVIANHGTGEHYTVPSGSSYYWVNSQGEYFGTNNSNYDPRIDPSINNTEWTKFEVEN